jgi:hypothetical protein
VFGSHNMFDGNPDSAQEWSEADQSIDLGRKLTLVWSWIFLALNTTMTMSIIYKILSVTSYPSELSC